MVESSGAEHDCEEVGGRHEYGRLGNPLDGCFFPYLAWTCDLDVRFLGLDSATRILRRPIFSPKGATVDGEVYNRFEARDGWQPLTRKNHDCMLNDVNENV